jgi:hypothetical protein
MDDGQCREDGQQRQPRAALENIREERLDRRMALRFARRCHASPINITLRTSRTLKNASSPASNADGAFVSL